MINLQDAGNWEPQCPNPFLGGPSLSEVCAASTGPLFLALLNALVATNSKIGDPCGRVTPIKRPAPSYDFIVVGGGAAGPVVAARLSEIEKFQVFLIEAGPDEPAGAEIPSNLQLYLNTELDWQYRTTNESHACLKNNGSCAWPRGKNLGGCTTHHGMAYHRGHPKDYARWIEKGNTGWSWDDVFPYFLKSEDNREIGRVSAQYHATGGPMTVERFPWQPKISWDILNAAKEKGFGNSEDLVGKDITGFTIAQTISKDGVRLSSAAAFLRPNRDRKNLHISLNSTVTKVLTIGKKVIGVQFLKDGKLYTVRAKREVILSAGAINSPQLLMLSGIGPKNHLKSLGIPVVHDLPGVGENLHNHASYGVDFTLDQPVMEQFDISNADLYVYNQTGPFSGTGLAQLTGILPSSFTTKDDPDTQFFFAGFQATCNTNGRIADLQSYDNQETVRFTAVNLQTRSRGRITLENKDPLSPPIIWSNDLGHPQDIAVIIEGLRVVFSLANATALQKYGLTHVREHIKECSNFPYDSDEYWGCAIQWNTRPENHQAGTCKMGPASDPLAVVDTQLKVHGIRGLRVADASIMPTPISGNPVAAINMIGERVADFIKKDWRV